MALHIVLDPNQCTRAGLKPGRILQLCRGIVETRTYHGWIFNLINVPNPVCPNCTLEDVLSHSEHWECATCGHEWAKPPTIEPIRVVKDAYGTPLADGDTVALIQDLKLRGSSQVLKQGTKAKNIHLVDGDHEIDCKIEGSSMALKACFVKKA